MGLYRGKRQEEHIKLATEYGKTQLNMGYLVNSQREKRGAGFELRTDSLSSPFSIEAGDPIGHMGYYQAPKDGGYEARYQVHIECTSMDDNLEKFLTNP
ncbi:hypothetical protein IAL14_004293, partial [Salmonella enterica]|nr:hypothetical protein [Salmonella enterica]